MNWEHVFLISFPNNYGLIKPDDDIVTVTSDAMRLRYSIPQENCYSMNKVFGRRNTSFQYNDISRNCIKAKKTEKTKLIIVGHASTFMKCFTPFYFSKLIQFCGAQNVSYITFKSCNIGNTNYLITLRELLPDVQLFSAYKGEVAPNFSKVSGETKFSIRLRNNYIENFLYQRYGKKIPDMFRREIVLGKKYNQSFFKDTKYFYNKTIKN